MWKIMPCITPVSSAPLFCIMDELLTLLQQTSACTQEPIIQKTSGNAMFYLHLSGMISITATAVLLLGYSDHPDLHTSANSWSNFILSHSIRHITFSIFCCTCDVVHFACPAVCLTVCASLTWSLINAINYTFLSPVLISTLHDSALPHSHLLIFIVWW